MSLAKFIWFAACVFSVMFFGIYGTFNAIRMQDLSRTTDESATCHVQAENFALDALDMYLEEKHKHEGVAIIKDTDVPKVKRYVADKVAMFDDIKGDVYDLRLSNVYVYPGVYGVTSSGSSSGDSTMVQTFNEVPYYRAKISGKIKTLIRGANNATYVYFEQDVFVRASHILRN